eukprot:TRINITY_DN12461_c0_g1_i2.p1 TRINITY_DN12461_c0_g1~~TRINITY_DN12461_c0_g1_i2.p1  ORF type:complete len:479 (+),score=135.24 TRINITY_DN12461_c0_g1_i2:73-1509(+)
MVCSRLLPLHVLLVALAALLSLCPSSASAAASSPDRVLTGPIPLTANPQYAGLLPVNESTGSEMYYWFFEQTPTIDGTPLAPARNLSDVPLIVWLEGGPGIGALFQVFEGMGPYRMDPDAASGVTFNRLSWLRDSHLLFLDNPCGTGFSRVDPPYAVTNQEQVAAQLYVALQRFYAMHQEYAACPLFIFGESYGGKYVPAVASYIHARQEKGVGASEDDIHLPLVGIGIGDGLVDTPTQVQSYVPFLEGHSLLAPTEKAAVQEQVDAFAALYEAQQYENASNIFWGLNYNFQFTKNVNFYNIECYLHCSGDTYKLNEFAKVLANPDVQKQLHTPGGEYASPSRITSVSMNADVCKSVQPLMPELLDNYRVLLYQGTNDLIVNAVGTDMWLSRTEWEGRASFDAAPRATWFSRESDDAPGSVDVAGYVQQAHNLSLVVLPNSGHFTAMDLPRTSREMVRRFLADLPWKLDIPPRPSPPA